MNKIIFSFRPLEHQKSSITKMKNIENNMISFSDIKVKSKIGILTDPKNSGKKTTMSYFLKRCSPLKNVPFEYSNNNLISVRYLNEKFFHVNIIIANNSDIKKWQYIDKYTNLGALFFMKSIEVEINNCKFKKNSTIILNYNKFKELDQKLNHPKWNRIIIDSPEKCKKEIDNFWKSNFIWFITNCPDLLYFSKIKSFSYLFNNLPNYCFELIIVKNNINNLLKSFKIVKHKVTNIHVKNSPEKYFKLIYDKDIITYNIKKKEVNELLNNLQLDSLDKIIPISINCPITLDKIKYPVKMDCCNNFFSLVSILKCYQKDHHCPLCRSKFNLSNIKLNFKSDISVKNETKKIKISDGLFICQNSENDFYILKQVLGDLNNYTIKSDNFKKLIGNNYTCFKISSKAKEKSNYISIIYYSSIENDILFSNIYKKYSIFYNNKKIKFYKVYN